MVPKDSISLDDLQFEPYLNEDKIETAIAHIAEQLMQDYKDKEPLFLVVLSGAFIFASELIKRYKGDCKITFVKLNSYEGTTSTEQIQESISLSEEIEQKDVVIVEDIVDTGHTMDYLMSAIQNLNPTSVKIATLFFKSEAYLKNISLDYIGLNIPNKFIVGYGLDYKGLGRNLTSVYQLKSKKIMTNLVLFGPPGAGKGTQAQILKNKYDLIHISTGDVFRFNIKNKTELGTLAKSYIDKGQLVPDQVTIDMLNAEVDKNPEAKGFIFDGFPRTEAQADALETLLESKGSQVNAMIALEVDDEILVQRLLERGITSGRPDDADEAVIRNRIKVYYTETAILKDYYQNQDKYYGVDGVGGINEITDRLYKVIDTL